MNHDGGEAAYAAATTIATWPTGSFAENLAVDAPGAVFVTLHGDRAVVRVDPATGAVDPFATLPLSVAGLVHGTDGALYVSGGTPGHAPGAIWRIDREGRHRLEGRRPAGRAVSQRPVTAPGRAASRPRVHPGLGRRGRSRLGRGHGLARRSGSDASARRPDDAGRQRHQAVGRPRDRLGDGARSHRAGEGHPSGPRHPLSGHKHQNRHAGMALCRS